jgi:hypothetical protein
MPKLNAIRVSLNLPFELGGIEGEWEPDKEEKKAAWEMYVELVTRITVIELGPGEGLLREALASMYSIFGTTREIMRKYGPGIAQPKGKGTLSFGFLAVTILNHVLRPFTARWHPLLEDYEHTRAKDVSRLEHERRWEHHEAFRNDLVKVQSKMKEYANLLAQVAEIPPLTERPSEGAAE